MIKMPEQQSIKNTLNIIRKAIEEDDKSESQKDDSVLILNKLINEDGTIHILENNFLKKEEVKEILNQKISEIFQEHLDNWLDRNVPRYLDKYFKKK